MESEDTQARELCESLAPAVPHIAGLINLGFNKKKVIEMLVEHVEKLQPGLSQGEIKSVVKKLCFDIISPRAASASESRQFVADFIAKPYTVQLVKRFVDAAQELAMTLTGIDKIQFYKLLQPEVYGPTTGRMFWKTLQDRAEELSHVDDFQIRSIAADLDHLDLSGRSIVYDYLAEETDDMPVSKLVEQLSGQRNTFSSLDLSDNMLSHEGIDALLPELVHHTRLTWLNISHNYGAYHCAEEISNALPWVKLVALE